jgi:hypothetical protein
MKSMKPLAVAAGILATGGAQAQLPNPGLSVDRSRTALVVTDPQNDFLSPSSARLGQR